MYIPKEFYKSDLFTIADISFKMAAAMFGIELAIKIVTFLPTVCEGAYKIYKKAEDMYNQFKTEKNNTPGTEAQNKQQEDMIMRETGDEMREISIGTESQIKQQGLMEREMRDEMREISIGTKSQIKQQGQMMGEMRDEMRAISIASKLSSERISQVFRQVRYLHIFIGTVA